MIKTTLKISGMMCGMCEAHINDAVRAGLPVKKVASSHAAGRTVIFSDAPLDKEKLRQIVNATGYALISVGEETVVKGGFLSGLLKR